MFDLTTYVKKWQIRQLKTVFSTLDTLCSSVAAHRDWIDKETQRHGLHGPLRGGAFCAPGGEDTYNLAVNRFELCIFSGRKNSDFGTSLG